ncbi:TPA: hypothetical protein U2M54_001115 [Providencia rettgeri]|nr:hypothetical protein [Providencia rettgeri]MCL0009091.1 hypothetical protein [Providencia rettgeri]HEM8339038.1 hypothetical protein [Providencia rettgeri]
MDKSRQQFERKFYNKFNFELTNKGNYRYFSTNIAWESWQASRESLINSLEPVGYITSSRIDNIKEYGYTHLNEEKSEKINIPLYRLDK